MDTWRRQLWLVPLTFLLGCGGPPPATVDPAVSVPDAVSTPALRDAAVLGQEETATDSIPEATPAAIADPVILPGERVGPITPTTTHADLVTRFGAEVLREEAIAVGEGFTEPATVVDLGPEYGFTVVWGDENRDRVATVRELGTAWATPNGIHVGSSFADLQEALGSFGVYGFRWDYGGTVDLRGSTLSAYDGQLFLRLHPANIDDVPNALAGDTLFPSDTPALDTLNLTVNSIVVVLTP